MTTTTPEKIQDQVKLPLSIAFEVVLQGIRTRLGRSVVTISGVILGIAFLMSILASQLAKQGVSEESNLRIEVKRMMSFLTAESGPLAERIVGVYQAGPLDVKEARLIQAILNESPQKLHWTTATGARVAPQFAGRASTVPLAQLGSETVAVLIVGDGPAPAINWDQVLASARQKVLAFSRNPSASAQTIDESSAATSSAPEKPSAMGESPATAQTDGSSPARPGNITQTNGSAVPLAGPDNAFATTSTAAITRVSLARQLNPDELQAQRDEFRHARFRNIWIIIISLAVTVIGISNAMLMSVTERFREIGTMKCLGALSSFIRRLFLIESSLLGIVGGIAGTILGAMFSIVLFSLTYGFGIVLSSMNWPTLLLYGVFSVVASVVLSIIAALYPASFAARMVPATALRTNI